MRIIIQACLLLALPAMGGYRVIAAPVATNGPVMSVFTLPTSPGEGRDPFYPNSTRLYEETRPHKSHSADLTSLKIIGFSEIAGHRYVIINNHTFGSGDEGDVITPDGRIHLRCLEVGDDSVLVESGGARHLLKFSGQ